MKEQPSFYAFFIRKMVAPTGDPKEIVVEGEWLHALEYLRRLDKKNVIGDKWHDTSCHNRRAIVCEDLPPHNIQFVRDNNPGVFIP